jgi:hypothetical protein
MTELNVLLNELYTILKTANPALAGLLQQGLDKAAIDRAAGKAGLTFPDELYALYGWKNGMTNDIESIENLRELRIFPLAIYLSLSESLEDYGYNANNYWPRNLFPVFTSGGGDYYLLNCEEGTPSRGMIYYFCPSDYLFQGVITKFDSLPSLISSVIECYAEKVYYFDDAGTFIIADLKQEHEIIVKNNPRAEYWKLINYE